MGVQPIPDGYHTVTPYLIVEGGQAVLDFIVKAFEGRLKSRMDKDDGTIGHAEVAIGDSLVMLGDAGERWPAMPAALHLYVEDCDATYRRALDAGAASVQEPEDQFYGDRMAGVRDGAGNMRWIATHVEAVDEEEMARRAARWAAQGSSA